MDESTRKMFNSLPTEAAAFFASRVKNGDLDWVHVDGHVLLSDGSSVDTSEPHARRDVRAERDPVLRARWVRAFRAYKLAEARLAFDAKKQEILDREKINRINGRNEDLSADLRALESLKVICQSWDVLLGEQDVLLEKVDPLVRSRLAASRIASAQSGPTKDFRALANAVTL